MYVDGKPIGVKYNPDLKEVTCYNYLGTQRSSAWYLGGIYQLANPDNMIDMHHFKIDEMRVWKKVLSRAQLNERMHRVLTPEETTSPDLMIYWDFNDVQGHIHHDRSPNMLDLEMAPSGHEHDVYKASRMPTQQPSTAPVVGSALKFGV